MLKRPSELIGGCKGFNGTVQKVDRKRFTRGRKIVYLFSGIQKCFGLLIIDNVKVAAYFPTLF